MTTVGLYVNFIAVYLILAWAIYFPFRAGQFFNGPIYSMAIGAYFSAYAVRDLGWPFAAAMAGAAVLGGLAGLLPALGFSRTSGIATATGSMALIFIIQSVLRNLQFLGGAAGFFSIPKVTYLPIVSAALVLIVGLLLYRFDHSRLGRTMEAILGDSELPPSLGVNARNVHLFTMTFAAVLGALAGVIYAFTLKVLYPDLFGFGLLTMASCMMFIGGRYTMWGSMLSAPLLWLFPRVIPREVAQYANIAYGCILVFVMVFFPRGLVTRRVIMRLGNIASSVFRRTRDPGLAQDGVKEIE
jgi:branched-chain amino acid transport system permease protein